MAAVEVKKNGALKVITSNLGGISKNKIFRVLTLLPCLPLCTAIGLAIAIKVPSLFGPPRTSPQMSRCSAVACGVHPGTTWTRLWSSVCCLSSTRATGWSSPTPGASVWAGRWREAGSPRPLPRSTMSSPPETGKSSNTKGEPNTKTTYSCEWRKLNGNQPHLLNGKKISTRRRPEGVIFFLIGGWD